MLAGLQLFPNQQQFLIVIFSHPGRVDTYPDTSDMQKQACGIVGGFMEDIFGKELKPWQESEKPEMER